MQIAASTATTGPAAAHAGAKPAAPHRSAFHTFLSELNPLQYLPVVGTIYRAITGDTIPEAARIAGSLVVSGLTGGPIGIAMNVGATALEHVLGLDPEKIGSHILASLGIGGPAAPIAVASAAGAAKPVQVAALQADAMQGGPARAWSSAQLAAYGVSSGGGQLVRGTVQGADVLNGLELARIGGASALVAYA